MTGGFGRKGGVANVSDEAGCDTLLASVATDARHPMQEAVEFSRSVTMIRMV